MIYERLVLYLSSFPLLCKIWSHLWSHFVFKDVEAHPVLVIKQTNILRIKGLEYVFLLHIQGSF